MIPHAQAIEPTLLVIGAAPHSLGAAIVEETEQWSFREVVTAGLDHGEQHYLDVTDPKQVRLVLRAVQPDYVVCTAGINTVEMGYERAFQVNCAGVMDVLQGMIESPRMLGRPRPHSRKFVAISSNSARIPRTGSGPYCASKAALSMALRVAAREWGGGGIIIYGYEPGLLAGTPMTKGTLERFGDPEGHGVPLHRMKGVAYEGLPTEQLAAEIVSSLVWGSQALNGCLIPFDAGEL